MTSVFLLFSFKIYCSYAVPVFPLYVAYLGDRQFLFLLYKPLIQDELHSSYTLGFSSIFRTGTYYEVIDFDPFAEVRGDVGNPGKGPMCLHVGGM